MMFAAIVLLVGRVAGMLTLCLFVYSFVLKLRREERMLLKQFPTAYPEYMKKTKMLVPFMI